MDIVEEVVMEVAVGEDMAAVVLVVTACPTSALASRSKAGVSCRIYFLPSGVNRRL